MITLALLIANVWQVPDPLSIARQRMEDLVRDRSAVYKKIGPPVRYFPAGRADVMYIAQFHNSYALDRRHPNWRPLWPAGGDANEPAMLEKWTLRKVRRYVCGG